MAIPEVLRWGWDLNCSMGSVLAVCQALVIFFEHRGLVVE